MSPEVASWMMILPLLVILFLSKTIYNLCFHPLRHFPGPSYARASRLWYSWTSIRGTTNFAIKDMHDKFGDVVRVAPDELSYNCSKAWQPIYGLNAKQVSGSAKMILFKKDPVVYGAFPKDLGTVFDDDGRQYQEQKRPLLKGFSPKALATHEDFLSVHMDRAISKLKDSASQDTFGVVDVRIWISHLLFDYISTLTVGENLHTLNDCRSLHPAISNLSKAVLFGEHYIQFRRLPRLFASVFEAFLGLICWSFIESLPFLGPMFAKRLDSGSEKTDLVSFMRNIDGTPADRSEVFANGASIIIAGTEGTSSWLLGTLYYLLANSDALRAATEEVRSCFDKKEDITFLSTKSLVYLKACMKEAGRLFPSVRFGLPRLVPKEGAIICGQFVSGNTTVGVNHYATYRSEKNFKDAEEFKPQRWMGDDDYSGDTRDGFKPFSCGPRVCIGKNMAEMNGPYILARLLWEFDLELDKRSRGWDRQKGWTVPRRGSLFVKINDCRM